MCDDGGHVHAAGAGVSRRGLLQGMVALAALAACSPDAGSRRAAAPPSPLPSRPPNPAGLSAYVLGMHLHASTSEGVGSVRSHLAQAAANGFDVAWFTEHDWRRRRMLFRPAYHFLANDVAMGGRWTLGKLANTGSLTSASGGLLVTSPVSPSDRGKGALRLRATSTGTAQGTVRYRVNAEGASRANFRARIAGRTMSVDVLPTKSGANSWAEVLVKLSHHPGAGTRPSSVFSLLYRLRTDIATRMVTAQGTTGIIDVPVAPNAWRTVIFDLTRDAAAVWPTVPAEDNALGEIEFHAASRRKAAGEVFFSYLRFDEIAGYDLLGVEYDLLAAYADDVPGVLGLVGTEISLGPHLNQYGGVQDPYDYGRLTGLSQDLGEIRPDVVDFVHRRNGLASINHPFKPGDTGQLATARDVAVDLLSIGAGGADILEVGYANRYGGDLAEHLAVWDTLSRNALFLTANGVSDDHTGQGWAAQANRFYTATWAGAKQERPLLDALAAGRSYVGFLGGFTGTVDMDLDGTVRMGQVSANSPARRTLHARVSTVPSGGAVQLVRGVVDRAGQGSPTPNTTVRTIDHTRPVELSTGEDCFHRLQVVNSAGAVVAFGQPIWTFRGASPTPVPAGRRPAG